MYRKIFVAILIVVVLLGFNFFVAKNFLENFYFGISEPVSSRFNNKFLGVSNYVHNLIYASQLAGELNRLNEENSKLIADNSRLNNTEEENAVLRTRLNLAQDTKRQLILANIFSLRGESALSSFMINRGTVDGVEEGLAVVTADNILAGVVVKTYSHSALVLMSQNRDLSLNVQVSGKNILARSQGNGSAALLSLVTNQEDVVVGDIIVTSGLDKIPSAIPIFKVVEVQPAGGSLFQKILVAPIFNSTQTSEVFIIK